MTYTNEQLIERAIAGFDIGVGLATAQAWEEGDGRIRAVRATHVPKRVTTCAGARAPLVPWPQWLAENGEALAIGLTKVFERV